MKITATILGLCLLCMLSACEKVVSDPSPPRGQPSLGAKDYKITSPAFTIPFGSDEPDTFYCIITNTGENNNSSFEDPMHGGIYTFYFKAWKTIVTRSGITVDTVEITCDKFIYDPRYNAACWLPNTFKSRLVIYNEDKAGNTSYTYYKGTDGGYTQLLDYYQDKGRITFGTISILGGATIITLLNIPVIQKP